MWNKSISRQRNNMYKVCKLWKRLSMIIVWKENVSNVNITIIVLDIDLDKKDFKR